MTRCPVCKNQMFIVKSDNNNEADEFNGEILHYTQFYQCPKCEIFGFKYNATWGIGMQRIKMNGKWYYYYGRWKPLIPLIEAQKIILKTPLNPEEEKTIKFKLSIHLTNTPFVFR